MKRNVLYAMGFALISGAAFTSCSENELVSEGEGKLQLKVNMESEVSVVTRAAVSDEELAENAVVRIYSENGLIRKYTGLATLPAEMPLKSGAYSVKVLAGDSVPASFDKIYYKGIEPFTVRAGELASVAVPCKIANSLTAVAFDKIEDAFTDYSVKLYLPKDTLTFTKENVEAVGYFMMPEGQTSLGWIFEGIQPSGLKYQQEGSIEDIKPTTKYTLTFSFKESDAANGGALVQIEVDQTEIRVDHDVVIFKRPDIIGENFAIDEPLYFELDKGEDVSLWVSTSSRIKSMRLDSDHFGLVEIPDGSLELVDMNPDQASELELKGLIVNNKYDEVADKSNLKVTFAKSFIKKLTASEGEYQILLTATDNNDKVRTAVLRISASDAQLTTLDALEKDIWTSKAVLRGSVLKETAEPLSFRYRVTGDSNWSTVDAVRDGNQISADITGLIAGATYEYQAVAGETASSVVCRFTTEAAAQLPNNSFEFWSKPGKPWLIYGDGQEMFWDSGNHGSSTMNVNVTNYDTSVKNSGNYSIKLQSQFVGVFGIGKFAAGNVFAGEYLATDGTDGILGFGRPFTSRPARLRGHFKYNTGDINYSSLSEVPTGRPDTAHFYIAIGDWTPVDYEGKQVPVLIKTKASARQLFDPKDPAIIAFGEMQTGQSTDGDGLHEFVVDLDYRSLDRKPKYIVVVASASKYGDYFTGSTSSTMWLDDLELIYE